MIRFEEGRKAVGSHVAITDEACLSFDWPPGTRGKIVSFDEDDEAVPWLVEATLAVSSSQSVRTTKWLRERDVTHAPLLAPPPRFSSPEEADAWLEARGGGVAVDVVAAQDPFAPDGWLVQVYRPDGTLAFQAGVEIEISRADNENVRTVLAVASRTAGDLPF